MDGSGVPSLMRGTAAITVNLNVFLKRTRGLRIESSTIPVMNGERGKRMIYKVTIPMKLPSLNQYINVCRTNPYMASKFKKDIERDISVFLSGLPKFEKPIKIHFHWVEDNRKRDIDNIAYSKKHILDAMVKCGVLTDDSRNYVTSFTDTFEFPGKKEKKEAHVDLEISEVE